MWKQKLAALLISTAFTIGLVLLVGHFVKIGDDTINKKLFLRYWWMKERLFGKAEIGIFELDSTLGWVHKPNSTGKHYVPYGFKAKYHIDAEGNRVTKGDYSLPKILFLGCSYTFGHGVQDDEVYVSLLAEKFPQYKVINGAAMAYGPTQALLKTERELTNRNDIRLVVYPFIGHHIKRSYLRKEWLDMLGWGRKNPHFEIKDGKLERLGLADPVKDGVTDETALAEKEKSLTAALIAAMWQTCEARNVPFVVVHLPDDQEVDFKNEILTAVDSSHFVDLRGIIDFKANQIPMDGHPNPAAHQAIAISLVPVIERYLLQPDTISQQQ
jgi:hypothetical protein